MNDTKIKYYSSWPEYEKDAEAGCLPDNYKIMEHLQLEAQARGVRCMSKRTTLAQRDKPAAAVHESETAKPLFNSSGGTFMNPNQPETSEQIEARCKATWKSDSAIRSEFFSLESYTAFERANAAGRIRIFGGNTVQRGR